MLVSYAYLDVAEIKPVLEAVKAESCRSMLYPAGL
jgi:hypothetical protein